MLRSYWLPSPPIGVGIVALFLLVGAGLQNWQKTAEHDQPTTAKQHQDAARQVVQRSVTPVIASEAPPRNPKPDRNEWRSESDLEAQWEAADWTKYATIAAWVGVIVAGAGIWFVWKTLSANLDAVKASTRAATAAEAAVAVAQETAKQQLRAYVHIVSVQYVTSDWHPPYSATASIEIRNYGQTPAHDLTIWTDIDFRPCPLDEDLVRGSGSRASPKCVLAPGADTNFFEPVGYPIVDSRIDDVRAGRMGLYVFGEITYTDAFDEPHTTPFRMVYCGPDAVRTGHFANYDDDNKST